MVSRLKWFAPAAALIAVTVVSAAASAARAGDFFFRDGDTVVMLGDSITEQYLYSNYVEMWTVSRFPAWTLVFRNTGIGGDRSPGGNARFRRDVLRFHPTAMTVDFGMNDANYRGFDPAAFKTYMAGLQGIADQAKAAHIRVAWLTPSPVEKRENGPALQGYNQTLEKFSAGVKEIAARNGGWFVNQFHPFLKIEDKARAANPSNRIGGGDVVHPGPPGQALMAWAILKGLHFPTQVSSADIDAAGDRVTRAEHCTITDLNARHGVHFQRRDDALPFFPAKARSILRWVPILHDLNHYDLKVTGLKPGRYAIHLGGTKIAEHSAEELARGVNLAAAALAAGPVADQVQAVWQAVQAKNRYFHAQVFRGVVLAPKLSAAQRHAEFTERMARMPELDRAVHRALVIRPHQVDVVPVADETSEPGGPRR